LSGAFANCAKQALDPKSVLIDKSQALPATRWHSWTAPSVTLPEPKPTRSKWGKGEALSIDRSAKMDSSTPWIPFLTFAVPPQLLFDAKASGTCRY